MSIYSNISEKDLINLRKLAEQQKNERALKIKNSILKKTHDEKLAESLSPITKKLDTINESTKKIGDVIKESNSWVDLKSIPNNPLYSKEMQEMIGSLMSSRNSLKIVQEKPGRSTILGEPIQISSNSIKINGNIYNLNPEVYKVLSNPLYAGNTMKNDDDFVMLYNNLKDNKYTVNGDRPSNRKNFCTRELPKKVSEINNVRFIENTDDSDSDLQGEGAKIIIPSNIIDFYTRLEILLGLKLSGHTDTLTEASNLIDELYKRGEIQNKEQYQNALNKFSTP